MEEKKISGKQNFIQFLKFTVFSISAGAIQIATFTLLNEFTEMSYWPCYIIGLVLSVIFNFTINREFTFKAANNVPLAMLKVACYYAVFTPLSAWWGQALVGLGWNEYLVTVLTMVVNFVTEFLFDRFFVFGKSVNTNKRAKAQESAEADKSEDKKAA